MHYLLYVTWANQPSGICIHIHGITLINLFNRSSIKLMHDILWAHIITATDGAFDKHASIFYDFRCDVDVALLIHPSFLCSTTICLRFPRHSIRLVVSRGRRSMGAKEWSLEIDS